MCSLSPETILAEKLEYNQKISFCRNAAWKHPKKH